MGGKRVTLTIAPSASGPFKAVLNGCTVTAEGMEKPAAAASSSAAPASGEVVAQEQGDHRYRAQIDAACARYIQISDETDWLDKGTAKGVQILQKPTPVQPLPVVRGVLVTDAYSPHEVAAVVDSNSARKICTHPPVLLYFCLTLWVVKGTSCSRASRWSRRLTRRRR